MKKQDIKNGMLVRINGEIEYLQDFSFCKGDFPKDVVFTIVEKTEMGRYKLITEATVFYPIPTHTEMVQFMLKQNGQKILLRQEICSIVVPNQTNKFVRLAGEQVLKQND